MSSAWEIASLNSCWCHCGRGRSVDFVAMCLLIQFLVWANKQGVCGHVEGRDLQSNRLVPASLEAVCLSLTRIHKRLYPGMYWKTYATRACLQPAWVRQLTYESVICPIVTTRQNTENTPLMLFTADVELKTEFHPFSTARPNQRRREVCYTVDVMVCPHPRPCTWCKFPESKMHR